jgi:hypothetical protein
LATAVGAGTLTSVFASGVGTVTFDQRGAVTPPAVDVLYVGFGTNTSLGYRAVILLPGGSVQTWSGDANGNWHQIN